MLDTMALCNRNSKTSSDVIPVPDLNFKCCPPTAAVFEEDQEDEQRYGFTSRFKRCGIESIIAAHLVVILDFFLLLRHDDCP